MLLCNKDFGASAVIIFDLSASASHVLHAYVYVTCSSMYNSAGLYFSTSFDLLPIIDSLFPHLLQTASLSLSLCSITILFKDERLSFFPL